MSAARPFGTQYRASGRQDPRLSPQKVLLLHQKSWRSRLENRLLRAYRFLLERNGTVRLLVRDGRKIEGLT